MEPIDLLLTRRSVVVKNITEPGPGNAELEKILRAGIRVPDHGKIAPWRIQVLHEDGQRALGDIFAELYRRDNPGAEAAAIETERARPQRAPVLIVVTAKLDAEKVKKVPFMEQKLSGGALCQNILTAAAALGYAAQWITEWPAYHAGVKEALGHDAGDDLIGFIYIGTAAEPPAERMRAEYGDVVSAWAGR